MRASVAISLVALTLTGAVQPSAAGTSQALNARDAGARYGQALGASEICIGWHPSEKANALGSAYAGADLDAFKAQTAKVLDAWVKVKNCANQGDPNQCKIIMDSSCGAAIAEIGPTGTAIPGLLEPPSK